MNMNNDELNGDLFEMRGLDLSLDDTCPETVWEVFTAAADDAVMEYDGEVALVLEPEMPVDTEDEFGRHCVSLQMKMKPVVPSDTAWILIFAIDNNYEITVAVSMPLHADVDSELVEVTHPMPHSSWVLTEDEEEVHFVTIIMTEESIESSDDYDSLVDAAQRDYTIEELIETIEWAMLHDAVDVHINCLSVEATDAIMEQLQWK